MISKLIALCFSVLSILPTPLFAREQILCQTTGQSNVVITLGSQTKFGRVLDCIAGDFAYDMTPCAPDGGFGLSYPTGLQGALVSPVSWIAGKITQIIWAE
jgi:hypothetical protein